MQTTTTNPPSFAFMTYNILVGGEQERIPQIEAVIRHVAPDIVGIQEANDSAACQAMAERLGMHCRMGYARNGIHVALLSRWPIRSWTTYGRPIFQKGLLAAEIELPGEAQPWQVFVTHLTADFYRGRRAERRRAAEVRTIIECMETARARGCPHVLLGDFNAMTPGEALDTTNLITQVIAYDVERKTRHTTLQGRPQLHYIVPRPLRHLMPLARLVPHTPWLAATVAFAANLIIPRLAVRALPRAGYTDCLRVYHTPRTITPTCPLPRPAGRIDYIWADPHAAQRLLGCSVEQGGPDCPVATASDHRPVVAHFVRTPASQEAIPPPSPTVANVRA